MLTGRFGATSGRPYIEGRIYFPRLKIHGDVSFLLDTGADHSVLMPSDAIRLNVPFDKLQGDMPATGVGGEIHFYQEDALLVFSDPNVAVYVYVVRLAIYPVDPVDPVMMAPSLIGRDVIDHWRITYDPTNAVLQADILTADATYDTKSGPSDTPSEK